MPPDPDTDELARRVSSFEELFEELRQVVNTILEWKNQTTGGLKVTMWGLGILQSIVLLCLGFAANALNNTATTLGNHAVELATAKAEIKAFMQEEKFTADRNAVSEAALRDELKTWVRDELKHQRP